MESVKYYYFKLEAHRDATGSKLVTIVSRKCDNKFNGLADAIFEYQNTFEFGWNVTGVVVPASFALQWLASRKDQERRWFYSSRSESCG